MDYPIHQVLALLNCPRNDDSSPTDPEQYQQLLDALLAYEAHEVLWEQTDAHLHLVAVHDENAVRGRHIDRPQGTLGLGESLFFAVHHPTGYGAQITLYRPLEHNLNELRGTILLTPYEMQISWNGSTIMLYQDELLIDTANIDDKGRFTLMLANLRGGKARVTVRLRSGEILSMDDLTLLEA
jgi:hypothetical protein